MFVPPLSPPLSVPPPLLPLPVLDGFHVLSAGIEGISRRPLSLRFREVANVVGIVLVLGLMLFALKNDVVRKVLE
ncbi:MAG: hypothetical protein NVS4B10_15390 [Myxococcales bacterium]